MMKHLHTLKRLVRKHSRHAHSVSRAFFRTVRKHRTRSLIGGGAVALLFIAVALFASGSLTQPVHKSVALAPTPIGLGQGVAACFSSVGPDCPGGSPTTYTIDLNGNADGYCGDNYGYVWWNTSTMDMPDVYVNGAYYGQMACSGPYTISENGQAGTVYNIVAQGHFSKTVFGTGSFTVPTGCGGVANPTSITATCDANGNVALSWPSSGAPLYYPGIWVPTGTSCPAGWTLDAYSGSTQRCLYETGTTATSIFATIITGQQMNGAQVFAGVAGSGGFSYANLDTVSPPGTNFTCAASTSNPPVTATCDTNNAGVTLSWPAIAGATTYYPRVGFNLGSCPSGWLNDGNECYIGDVWGNTGGISATSVHFAPITPNNAYTTWVHSGNSAGANTSVNSNSFSCADPGTLTADPIIITNPPGSPTPPGGSTVLTWNCPNPPYTSSVGNGFSTGGALSGSITQTPSVTTTYSVTCMGSGGITDTPPPVTVTVNQSAPALSFAAPSRVRKGATATLTWSASSVGSCSIADSLGATTVSSVPATGGNIAQRADVTPPINGQTTYTLTCLEGTTASSISRTVSLIPTVIEK